jgi:hypothetical protein
MRRIFSAYARISALAAVPPSWMLGAVHVDVADR